MPANLTTLAAILKEDYVVPAITDELNNSVEIWNEVEKATLNWTGKRAIFPLRISRNGSVSAASSSNTPVAGEQGYVDLIVTAKKVYGTMQIEGVAIAASKTTKGAFLQQAKGEMDGLVKDFRKKLASYTFTGGPVIGYVWQLQNGAVWQYAGRTSGIAVGAGETVTFFRMSDYTAVGGPTQINSITGGGTGTLTLNAPINTAAEAAGEVFAVVVTGAQAALTEKVGNTDAVSAEPTGFIANMSQVSHFGVDRSLAANAVLRSNFRLCGANTRDVLSLGDLQYAINKTVTESGARPTSFWLSWMQLTSYTTLLQGTSAGNVRIDADSKGQTRKADPGYTDFAYGGVPFKCSDVCPDGIIFAYNAEAYNRASLSDGEFIDFGSGPIERVPNTDDGTATYRMYYDLVAKSPNRLLAITAITMS